jgi:hypothetical protein
VVLLSDASDLFNTATKDYLGGIIPHLATIYPTSIILLTALNKSHVDSTLKGQSFSQSLQFAPPAASAPNSTQSQHTSNDLEAGDIDGGSYPGMDRQLGFQAEAANGDAIV